MTSGSYLSWRGGRDKRHWSGLHGFVELAAFGRVRQVVTILVIKGPGQESTELSRF